jgi:hypothetical protein
MDGKKYSYVTKIRKGESDERKSYEYEYVVRSAGLELYKILRESRLPAVVDIEETFSDSVEDDIYSQYGMGRFEECRIDINVNPVQWHNVTMTNIDTVAGWYKKPKEMTIIEKVKFLLGVK